MLVSHRHKFIYTKTIKTAGTSVESYFERFCMPEREWTCSHFRDEYESESGIIGFRGTASGPPKDYKWWNHMPAALIRERLGEKKWASYLKFCVIRNPYDKAISAFYWFRDSKYWASDDRPTEFEDLDHERAKFEAWLGSSKLPIDRDKYLIDGKFCLDATIRHETLAADLEKLCARLGLPWDPALLPKLKAGFRAMNAEAGLLYTEKSRRIVEAAYSFEIDYFGYSFPASTSQSC